MRDFVQGGNAGKSNKKTRPQLAVNGAAQLMPNKKTR